MSELSIHTRVTEVFGVQRPILLAGMNKAAGPKLAAAVTNAGGIGVIGGHSMSPRILRMNIEILKKNLDNPDGIFGVDLLLPKVGGSARKTNYDYTKGILDDLIDIICSESHNIKLFVSAVGVPTKAVIKKLHKAGIFVMNMAGHPKHAVKACELGVDLICAQGGEGGGHTGAIPTSLLLPKCADICRRYLSPMTGKPVILIGAGGIYDGRGLASSLLLGAEGVWVGTRFVCCTESGASNLHKEAILRAGYDDTVRTLVYTGRPLRVVKNEYVRQYHEDKPDELKALLKKGIVPIKKDGPATLKLPVEERERDYAAYLTGMVAGAIDDIKPAKEIMDEMMSEAIRAMKNNTSRITIVSKL